MISATYLGLMLLAAPSPLVSGSGTAVVQQGEPAKYELARGSLSTEIIEASVGFLAPAARAGGELHYSYELTLLNHYRRALRLDLVEVLSAADPANVVASFDAAYLDEHFLRHGQRPPVGNRELAGNSFGVVNLWLALDEPHVPGEVFHRLHFDLTESEERRDLLLEVARTVLPPATALEFGAPFESGKWFYTAEGHRDTRTLTEGAPSYAQRFAFDWAKVDDAGRFADGDATRNEGYVTYGVPVLAVADATVTAIRDGVPDNLLGEAPAGRVTRETIAGNYVMLDIGAGLRAVYAHLIPGSIEVTEGARIKRGAVLGRLGNSGNSDGPHLHFHIETKAHRTLPLAGEGVPFSFESFDQLQRFSDAQLGAIFEANAIDLSLNKISRRSRELPLGHGLVEFRSGS